MGTVAETASKYITVYSRTFKETPLDGLFVLCVLSDLNHWDPKTFGH